MCKRWSAKLERGRDLNQIRAEENDSRRAAAAIAGRLARMKSSIHATFGLFIKLSHSDKWRMVKHTHRLCTSTHRGKERETESEGRKPSVKKE